MLAGTLLMVAPFALGFEPAGTVVAVVVGALMVGLALADTLSVASHYAFDHGLALGLLAAAVLVGFDGDRAAVGYLAATGAFQYGLIAITRYSRR